jgi:uncharacterized membrane protein YfcA
LNGIETLLAVLCGGAVGFALGLIGGGGSILAVPLLLYVVGIKGRTSPSEPVRWRSLSTHSPICIGAGTVKWPCAAVFAVARVVGPPSARRSANWSTGSACSCFSRWG